MIEARSRRTGSCSANGNYARFTRCEEGTGRPRERRAGGDGDAGCNAGSVAGGSEAWGGEEALSPTGLTLRRAGRGGS